MKMATMVNKHLLLLLLCYLIYFGTLLCYCLQRNADEGFDVRQHLCTVTRYDAAKGLVNNGIVPPSIPDGCTPIHLNLVARHGTRTPTKKRMDELDILAGHLKDLVNDAKQEAEKGNLSLEKIPDWLQGWQSPWKGEEKYGELTIEGKNEMFNLGNRIGGRFKDLFNEEYDPGVFTVKATNVSRVLDSAEAFSRGLFSGRGNLGPGHHDFAVMTESCESDTELRFFDQCERYKQYKKNMQPEVEKLKKPILDKISSSLMSRYPLNFTRQVVASLWFLCKQEASLMEITDQACALFTPFEVLLLEWTDDLELFHLKGYGNQINYLMAVPLLQDVVQSMEKAISANEGHSNNPGPHEKATLRFAHAETIIPFSCLLGLFLEVTDLERLKQEQPLEPPPKPPQKSNWRGSLVAPFAGNSMLVLYNCPANNANKYYVQVLHNEVPVPLPGCDDSDFCPFEVFGKNLQSPSGAIQIHQHWKINRTRAQLGCDDSDFCPFCPFENFMETIVNPHLARICIGKEKEIEPNYKKVCKSFFWCEDSSIPRAL